jgi:hypothetical protein
MLTDRCETVDGNVPENDYYDKPMKTMLVCTQHASALKPIGRDKALFA